MSPFDADLLIRIYPICIGLGIVLALAYAGCVLTLARRLGRVDQRLGRTPSLAWPYGWSQSTSLMFGAAGRRVAAEAPELRPLLAMIRVFFIGYVVVFAVAAAILLPDILRVHG